MQMALAWNISKPLEHPHVEEAQMALIFLLAKHKISMKQAYCCFVYHIRDTALKELNCYECRLFCIVHS